MGDDIDLLSTNYVLIKIHKTYKLFMEFFHLIFLDLG